MQNKVVVISYSFLGKKLDTSDSYMSTVAHCDHLECDKFLDNS